MPDPVTLGEFQAPIPYEPTPAISVGPVSLARIAQERAAGWPTLHPEDYCHRCGSRNPSWFTDRLTWLAATTAWAQVTGREGICCPACFIAMHEVATGERILWELAPASGAPMDEAAALARAAVDLAMTTALNGTDSAALLRAARSAITAISEMATSAPGLVVTREHVSSLAEAIQEEASLGGDRSTFETTITAWLNGDYDGPALGVTVAAKGQA